MSKNSLKLFSKISKMSCSPTIAQIDTSVPCVKPVFDRVFVDYLTLGCTQVSWDINSHFREQEPWVFQLQEAESDIATANWSNIGSPVTNSFLAIDPSQQYCGKEETAFYRVAVTTALGNTYYSNPEPAEGILDFKNWHFAQEIIRKENLRLRRLGVGQEGFLLKAKRSGTPCPDCLDPRTGEVTDSNCTTCFGQRWVGGFYDPISAYYGDFPPSDRYLHRELEQGQGMVNTMITQGIFTGLPFLAMGDVFVNSTSDIRYQVHSIKVLTHIKGVPVIQMVELRRIPTSWIVYQIPVPNE